MKKRIEKAVQDYRAKYYGKRNTGGSFYTSDFYEVLELSGGFHNVADIYKAIENSLEAGFMIGYRKAQRDHRKRRESR